jgi:uncharacterized protein with LGFP repeats
VITNSLPFSSDVEKRPLVYEEVGVAKREVQATERVTDTVRRKEGRIEGDVRVTGGAWDQSRTDYHRHWQERYGSTGQRWEDAEPAYRYGYEMRDRLAAPGTTSSPTSSAVGSSATPTRRGSGSRNPFATAGKTCAVVSRSLGTARGAREFGRYSSLAPRAQG